MAMRSVFVLASVLIGFALAQYTPDWDSLDKRPLPSWYDDSKVGIFIHWGVFSVPSYGCGGNAAEWYWWALDGAKASCVVDFHKRAYGQSFTYAEFAPWFTAVNFDANEWADIFAKSGAKYVVLTSKHHDGFCNWPSAESWNWNSVDTGPHQDNVGLITAAVRKAGLRMGLYHSLFEWFNPLYLADKANQGRTQDYVNSVLQPQLHDIVNKYSPEVVWADGDREMNDTYWQSKEFLAWLYNSSPVKDTVVVNDRWGSGDTCKHGGYYTCSDRYNPGKLQLHKYENALTLDKHSWGYNRNSRNVSDYLSVAELIYQVVSTVSTGGNVLVNVGPTEDGRIIPIFKERLLSLGSWLQVNGAAIYGTKPWRVQNDTAAENLWYTQSKNTSSIFAIFCGQWPASNQLVLNSPVPISFDKTGSSLASTVTLLGYGQVKWQYTYGKVIIQLPLLTSTSLVNQYGLVVQLDGFK